MEWILWNSLLPAIYSTEWSFDRLIFYIIISRYLHILPYYLFSRITSIIHYIWIFCLIFPHCCMYVELSLFSFRHFSILLVIFLYIRPLSIYILQKLRYVFTTINIQWNRNLSATSSSAAASTATATFQHYPQHKTI